MEDNDKLLELIEDYSEGLLSEKEAQVFEERLKTDSRLNALYEKFREAQQLLEISAGNILKEKLKKMNPSQKETEGRVVPMTKILWAVAAVMLVLFLTISYQNLKNQFSNQALLEEYTTAYATGPVRGESEVDSWTKAAQAFASKDYQAAMAGFGEVSDSSARYIEAQFYLGNAAILSGDYARAIPAFEKVIVNKDIRYGAAAEWYLVVAYLGEEKESQAKELAMKIFEDKNHAYHQIAGKFLNDLESFWR